MSETLEAPTGPATRVTGAGTWRVTWRGVTTVTRLELRQRVRSTRWIAVLVAWVLVLGALAALIHHAVFSDELSGLGAAARESRAGATMFGWVVMLVLALGSLVAPALSATSVNGDRSAGVLASLQATLLSPAEIALGKLLAAWLTAVALLAAATPFLGWAVVSGGTPAGRVAVTLTLLAVVLLVVCALGLGWSALTARTASSAVLTYLSVAFLGLGLPLLFGLMIPIVTATEEHRVLTAREAVSPTQPMNGSSVGPCVETTRLEPVTHYERIWWILAANPFVVIADASPLPPDAQNTDVLSATRQGVRDLRLGEPDVTDQCPIVTNNPDDEQRAAARERLGVVWPYGLGGELALGAGFVVLTVRRLRTPARTLPRGTRIA